MRAPALLLLLASPAVAQGQVCAGGGVAATPDGRLHGHLPYGDAPEAELAEAPPGFALSACLLRRDVIPDLTRLLAAAAADPAMAGQQLRGLSCFRSVLRQAAVFCRDHPASDADKAISVAPPGHSEHSTGYAFDVAVRPRGDCPDAEACMAATAAARWMIAHAPRFGFELSFPGGNKQDVKWEPWHWRWVGTSASAPGAARARFVFARARRDFPAVPAVDPAVRVIRDVSPPPLALDLPAWQPAGKKRKRR